MTFIVLFLLAIFSVLPGGIAGPACTRKHYQATDCIQKCKAKWGYPGSMMGTDAWGSVFTPTDSSSAAWDSYIAQACGLSTISSGSASGVAGAVGSAPSSVSDISVASSTSTPSPAPSSDTINTDDDDTSTDAGFVSSSISVTQSTVQSTSTQKVRTTTTPVVTKSPDPTPSKHSSSKQPQKATSTTTSSSKSPASTGSGSSSGSSGGTSSSDINAYLKGHNDARAKHGAQPLTWSDNLASKAQKWANGCVFQHSGGSLGAFGENLAAGTGSDYGIADAIASWVNEAKDYDPNNPQPSHFTQVVWEATTKVGCAVQSCAGIFAASFGKAQYYVCEYDPPGNFNNLFKENVQA